MDPARAAASTTTTTADALIKAFYASESDSTVFSTPANLSAPLTSLLPFPPLSTANKTWYFSLFSLATVWEKVYLGIGIFFAVLTGLALPLSTLVFYQLFKVFDGYLKKPTNLDSAKFSFFPFDIANLKGVI